MWRSSFMCIPGLHCFFAVWQSGFARKVKSQTLIAAGLLSAFAVSSAQASVAEQPQVLKGNVPRITKRLPSVGRLDANYRMEVAIGLPLRNREQLTNLLADVYD